MGLVRNRGTIIAVGTTAATASSDTYNALEGVVTIDGNFGVSFAQIDGTVLTDTYKQTLKGVADAGSITLNGHLDETAASGPLTGLAALQAAALDADDADIYNFKLTRANGRIQYVKARVFSFQRRYGNNGQLVGFTSMLMLQAAPTEAAPA
jgi:hypothetical protein